MNFILQLFYRSVALFFLFVPIFTILVCPEQPVLYNAIFVFIGVILAVVYAIRADNV